MSNYKVIKYSSLYYVEWQGFVHKSVNGTIFHEQKFLSYHEDGKFEDYSLLVYENELLIALFPAAKIERNGKIVLKSHPGTSYGGLVCKYETLKKVIEIHQAIENYAKSNGFSRIEFRQAPKIFLRKIFDQFDFALITLGYVREDQELSTCYDLSRFYDVAFEGMIDYFDNKGRNKVKKNIKKALRNGLQFRELLDSEIPEYYEMLLDNLKRHNVTPAHSLVDIIKLKNLYSHRVRLYGVFVKGKMAAGYLLFNINDFGWHVFYGSMNYEFQEDRPTTYGLFMLLYTYSHKREEYLNMGISTENGGRDINWGLLEFKESFRGLGIMRTYWSKDLK